MRNRDRRNTCQARGGRCAAQQRSVPYPWWTPQGRESLRHPLGLAGGRQAPPMALAPSTTGRKLARPLRGGRNAQAAIYIPPGNFSDQPHRHDRHATRVSPARGQNRCCKGAEASPDLSTAVRSGRKRAVAPPLCKALYVGPTYNALSKARPSMTNQENEEVMRFPHALHRPYRPLAHPS